MSGILDGILLDIGSGRDALTRGLSAAKFFEAHLCSIPTTSTACSRSKIILYRQCGRPLDLFFSEV